MLNGEAQYTDLQTDIAVTHASEFAETLAAPVRRLLLRFARLLPVLGLAHELTIKEVYGATSQDGRPGVPPPILPVVRPERRLADVYAIPERFNHRDECPRRPGDIFSRHGTLYASAGPGSAQGRRIGNSSPRGRQYSSRRSWALRGNSVIAISPTPSLESRYEGALRVPGHAAGAALGGGGAGRDFETIRHARDGH